MTPGIDETLPFHPLNIAVLTVSDTRSLDTDTSGDLLAQRLIEAGHRLAGRALAIDDVDMIRRQMRAWIADSNVDIILSTGGTGFSSRDVTPEAVLPLFDRVMDGFSVVFHQVSFGTVGISTLQSRALAGNCFIFCVPGSNGACRDAWDLVLAYELDSRYRPCSIAGHIARLQSYNP
jgi:molybdopterin adenylyltransferase